MPDLLINPKLETTLKSFASNPPQGILISGPKGSGKKSIATLLISKIVKEDSYSKVIKIVPLEGKLQIGILQLKQIKKILSSKDESYRIIYIPDADAMTTDAQNSILKILEEPPARVIFIFTSSSPYRLLQTIRSRVTSVKYAKPSNPQILEFSADMGISKEEANKFLTISRGRMGIFTSLCKGDENYHLLRDIDKAKDVLSEAPKDRFIRIDQLAKDKESTLKLLSSLTLVCEAALESSAKSGDYRKWLYRLKLVTEASDYIERSVSIKLVLTKLFLVL